ncbi:MAG: hypothetical protein R2795_24390 [Saprospiraceae bacterium]
MTKIFTFTTILILFFSACKQDKLDSTDAVATSSSSYAPPIVPDTSNAKVKLLLSTFWVAEHWVNHADNSQNLPNKGRWWRFNPDGTFHFGQWGEVLSLEVGRCTMLGTRSLS